MWSRRRKEWRRVRGRWCNTRRVDASSVCQMSMMLFKRLPRLVLFTPLSLSLSLDFLCSLPFLPHLLLFFYSCYSRHGMQQTIEIPFFLWQDMQNEKRTRRGRGSAVKERENGRERERLFGSPKGEVIKNA